MKTPSSDSSYRDAFPTFTEFWRHWGFSPWRQGSLVGVERRQRFVKDGILGSVAEYHALDYIVWTPGNAEEREHLWASLTPHSDVMTQRFLFLLDAPWPKRRIRSFAWGFKGYAEFYALDPVQPFDPKKHDPADLTGLVELALRLMAQGQTSP